MPAWTPSSSAGRRRVDARRKPQRRPPPPSATPVNAGHVASLQLDRAGRPRDLPGQRAVCEGNEDPHRTRLLPARTRRRHARVLDGPLGKLVNAYYLLVDANDGTLLWRKNITQDQTQTATYNVYTGVSPTPLTPSTVLPGRRDPARPTSPAPTSPSSPTISPPARSAGSPTAATPRIGNNVTCGLDLVRAQRRGRQRLGHQPRLQLRLQPHARPRRGRGQHQPEPTPPTATAS